MKHETMVQAKGALLAQAQNPETAVRVAGAERVECVERALGRAAEARTTDGGVLCMPHSGIWINTLP